jgi:hypothetical protein
MHMEQKETAEERLEAALKKVVEALPSAPPRQKAILFLRAGDICVSVEERRKALGWYGRAVDQLMELRAADEAARVCRLIVFVQPDAVRARGTLTWIAIGTDQIESALEHLPAYVEAARVAGQNTLAAQQLGWMFEVVTDPTLRSQIVEEMKTLGGAEAAARLAERRPPPAPLKREQLWAHVLDATVGGPARAARAGGG